MNTHLTGSIETPNITLDRDIADALSRAPVMRDELVATITRRLNPVPVNGERSIRDRFFDDYDKHHPDATRAQRSAAWNNSPHRFSHTGVRKSITWCAEQLADSETRVEMNNVERVLDAMSRYSPTHWSLWVDSADSQSHALAILTRATVGTAMARHAALVGMDDHFYRMVPSDKRALLLIAAWCAHDEQHAAEVRSTLGIQRQDRESDDKTSVDDDEPQFDATQIVDNITRRKAQLNRVNAASLFEALDDPRDVNSMSDADVLDALRNIRWPSGMSEADCLDVLDECRIPRSRTNPTWLTDHVHHDGERWCYDDQQITYTTVRGHVLPDGRDIRDASRQDNFYDWMAYNDAKKISAGVYKSSPKSDVDPCRLINDENRMVNRYDPQSQRFTTEKVKENLQSVRVNATSSFVRTIVFDIDHADAMSRIRSGLVPPPTYIVESTDNGHAHAAYVLREPFLDQSSWTLVDAIRARLSVVLGADSNFTHGYTKNPYSPSFQTHWGPSTLLYDISTLFDQSCTALEWHMDKPLGLRLYSSDRSGTNKLLKLCGADQHKSARNTREVHVSTDDSISRHQRTFDATRAYAYNSWSSMTANWFDMLGKPDLFRRWSADVERYALRAAETIRASSSDTSAFGDAEVVQIARSVVKWMQRNYRPKVSRSRDTDQSYATQRSVARAFESLADDLRRAFSALGRRCHRQLRVDAETRTIVLPDGVDVREAQRIYRRAFPGERLNAARCRRFLVSGDVVQREQTGRTLAELDTAERTRIVAHAMSTSKKTSWSMIEKRFRLKSGVLGRLIDAYKKHPSRVVDDETMTSADARARWQHSLRSDGSLVHPQRRSRSRMRQESFDAHSAAQRRAQQRSQRWTDVSDLDADTIYRLIDSEDAERLFGGEPAGESWYF